MAGSAHEGLLPYVPWADAIEWVAFGSCASEAERRREALDRRDRWCNRGDQPLLASLKARGGVLEGSDGPCCLLLVANPSAATQRRLRWISAKASRRAGRIVTFRELADVLGRELQALADAHRQLLDAFREGKLPAWGKFEFAQDERARRRFGSAAGKQLIPPDLLPEYGATITPYGRLGADPADPIGYRQYVGPVFRDVHFERHELLALWPAARAAVVGIAEPVATDRTGAPGRPTSRHLVEAEFGQRTHRGEVRPKIGEEAKALSSWLTATHPGFAQMEPRTIENVIRTDNQRHKRTK